MRHGNRLKSLWLVLLADTLTDLAGVLEELRFQAGGGGKADALHARSSVLRAEAKEGHRGPRSTLGKMANPSRADLALRQPDGRAHR